MNKEEILRIIQDNLNEIEIKELISKLTTFEIVNNEKETSYTREDKLAIFMDLFKGRDDFYPVRWTNNNRSGYSIACYNEWKQGICNKTLNKKCSSCINRNNIPLTSQIYEQHLLGKIVIGIYPLLDDDTCYFLAFDFDNKNTNENIEKEVINFINTCNIYNVPIYIERSRSGKGYHLWIFFREKVPALKARRLGSFLLSKTLENSDGISLKTFDRMFPSQDYLPKGGYGNLIVLPFQKEAMTNMNSVFVDNSFTPISDQWAYLKNIRRIDNTFIDELLDKVNDLDNITNEEVIINKNDSFVNEINIELNNMVCINTDSLNAISKNSIRRLACFGNPEFFRKQKSRISTYNTPMIIDCSLKDNDCIKLPRGTYDDLINLCISNNVHINQIDNRNKGISIDVEFNGVLKDYQIECLDILNKHNTGIVHMPTGSGKTVLACKLIAERRVNTLIIVNKISLLRQWVDRLKEYLNIDKIGELYANKSLITNIIDVASIKSLENTDILNNYGMVIVDECHHLAAYSYENITNKINSYYFYGLTATLKREDGHSPIVKMQCGNERFVVDNKKYNIDLGMDIRVIIRNVVLNYDEEIKDIQLYEINDFISKDIKRNNIILNDIRKEYKKNSNILVLVERLDHLDYLRKEIEKFSDDLFVYKGGIGKKQLKKYDSKNNSLTKNKIILSTASYIGEGFDDKTLNVLFITMPISGLTRIKQYTGRLLRTDINKTEVRIYDYVDINISKTRNMCFKRKNIYKRLGYKVEEG